MDLKDISNQVKFYVKKYGVFKTIKKCFVVVKNKEYIKHDYPYGSYIDWFKPNELFDKQVAEQRKHKFKNNPKISIVVPMYNTPKKFFEELVDS